MLRLLHRLLLLLSAVHAARHLSEEGEQAGAGGCDAVHIDFAQGSNPSVSFEWTDRDGATYTGWSIPAGQTDTSGGAFPGGSIRFRNVGFDDNGALFDLLVTVSTEHSLYDETVAIEYYFSGGTQGLLTENGYACLGFGVRPSVCYTGSALGPDSAECLDGSPTTKQAAEFDFKFVQAGTSEVMPAFDRFYTTFFDVDGDTYQG